MVWTMIGPKSSSGISNRQMRMLLFFFCVSFVSQAAIADMLGDIQRSIRENNERMKCGVLVIESTGVSYADRPFGNPAGTIRHTREEIRFDGQDRYRIDKTFMTNRGNGEVIQEHISREIRDGAKRILIQFDNQQASLYTNFETEYGHDIPFLFALYKVYGSTDLLLSEDATLYREGSGVPGDDHILSVVRSGVENRFYVDPANPCIVKRVDKLKLGTDFVSVRRLYEWKEVAPGTWMAAKRKLYTGRRIGQPNAEFSSSWTRELKEAELRDEPEEDWFSMEEIPAGFTFFDEEQGIFWKTTTDNK